MVTLVLPLINGYSLNSHVSKYNPTRWILKKVKAYLAMLMNIGMDELKHAMTLEESGDRNGI